MPGELSVSCIAEQNLQLMRIGSVMAAPDLRDYVKELISTATALQALIPNLPNDAQSGLITAYNAMFAVIDDLNENKLAYETEGPESHNLTVL